VTIGPGKYDKETTVVMKATNAQGVILIVIGGDRGAGFSVQATLEATLALPVILRDIADQLETDFTRLPKESDG
jgi:hypothetical protein